MSTPEQPKQFKASEWREHEDHSIGGNWFYRVGIIWDGKTEKVRVAKCKQYPGDVAQVQKVNFKTLKEYEAVDFLVRKFLAKLEAKSENSTL